MATTSFSPTPKQREAQAVLSRSGEAALYGGSRSGKTFWLCRGVFMRAAKKRSRHLIARFRFNHAKTSLWYDTIPKMLSLCFPDLPVEQNKSDWFYRLPNGSEIWLGGVDDNDRVEKILGNEYSTIYLNECSQITYDAVTLLQTRLAESSGLDLRLWYDFNPPTKKHWTYRYFVEGLDPASLKPLPDKIPFLLMNPVDNVVNLPAAYIERLKRLPAKQRDRFLSGLFTHDTDGALWDYQMIMAAQAMTFADLQKRRTVVAIDPAVTHNADSDETGIMVASEWQDGRYEVEGDYTCKASPRAWALRAIDAFETHNADAMVVETNQGGEMTETILRQQGFRGRVINVHAVKGKKLRAEPVVALYEQGLVGHADGLEELEGEMMEWVPFAAKDSPNRVDACVYALTELARGDPMGGLLDAMSAMQ